MWVNKNYEADGGLTWLEEFIRHNTLSTIVSHEPVRIAHMPVELWSRTGQEPSLVFHVPHVDPITQALVERSTVTVVVHGPEQYISPSLYRAEGLPTFNYGVAEITGQCRVLSQDELSDHLERLMVEREQWFADATGGVPWELDAAARARFDRLLPMVAGFELDLGAMQLKLKMGQNRPHDERQYTAERLRTTPGANDRVASVMEALL